MPIKGTDTCWPVKTPILYQLKSYGKIRDGGELGIMSEVHKNGYSATVLPACSGTRLIGVLESRTA